MCSPNLGPPRTNLKIRHIDKKAFCICKHLNTEIGQKKISYCKYNLGLIPCQNQDISMYETLTIAKLVMTIEQVLADTSWIFSCTQRLFDAINHTTKVTQSLQYLHIMVWQAHLCVQETLGKNVKNNLVKFQNKRCVQLQYQDEREFAIHETKYPFTPSIKSWVHALPQSWRQH